MPHTYVGSAGDRKALIAIVGEQPGKQEIRSGIPFYGPAGENLNECLKQAGIDRKEVYLTNVIKDLDAPLEDYISIDKQGRVTVKEKGERYIDDLREEIDKCEANVIVACGNVPLFALAQRTGITRWRGSVIESTLLPGRKVVPTLHPATYTREKLYKNPDAFYNKYLITMDLARAKDESGFSHFRTTPRQKLIKPSFSEALEFLSRCKAHCWNGGILDYDIELYNMELSCIGFALNEYESMCIPFVDSNGDYFTADQELSIMMRVNSIMGDKNFLKRGQNVIFDSHFLLRKYGIRTYSLHDTMVAQRILYPEFRIGLDFITSMWIPDIPYYKQDGKIWLNKAGEWETGWAYNCTDTLATAIAHPKQMAELEEQGNSRTYERQRLLIEPLTYMMERGIKVDLIGMEQESNESQEKLDKLQIELNTLAGKELNPNSPKQLKHYFYTELKHKPYLKDRVPTTNEDAMKRLARKGVKEANVILEMRKIRKRKGTYLVTDKVDSDGRLRCYYNPVGTRYSRISSSKSIFGTGTNLQNWPHDILRYLIADPGYVFYSLDLSQFENRVVAYVGKIANMIETFEKKLDMHRKTASLIFDKLYEEINDDERQDGKQSNHAFNYGYGPDSFSLKHEMPIDRARWIHQRYHEVYPELSSGYWRYVKDNLQSNRTLTNLFGRKTVFWGQWNDRLMNEAYSCIPQGTCGDLINERGLEYIYYNDHIFHDIELLTQVHDSIGFQIPMRVPMIDVAYMLRMIIDSLSEQLEFEGTKFDVPVDLTIGFNLNKGDGYELKSANIPEDVDTFADILSEVIDSKLVPF